MFYSVINNFTSLDQALCERVRRSNCTPSELQRYNEKRRDHPKELVTSVQTIYFSSHSYQVRFISCSMLCFMFLDYLSSAEPTQSSIAALSLSDVTTDLIGGKKRQIMEETLSGSGRTLLQ